jgi:hypothetical protein
MVSMVTVHCRQQGPHACLHINTNLWWDLCAVVGRLVLLRIIIMHYGNICGGCEDGMVPVQ